MTSSEPLTTERLREILSIIVGQPLTCLRQPFFQVFEFGQQLPYTTPEQIEMTAGQYWVSVYGSWAIVKHGRVIVSSGDHDAPRRRFYDRKTKPSDAREAARWQRARDFFDLVQKGSLVVNGVEILPIGEFLISLSEGYWIASLMTTTYLVEERWCIKDRIIDQTYTVYDDEIYLDVWKRGRG